MSVPPTQSTSRNDSDEERDTSRGPADQDLSSPIPTEPLEQQAQHYPLHQKQQKHEELQLFGLVGELEERGRGGRGLVGGVAGNEPTSGHFWSEASSESPVPRQQMDPDDEERRSGRIDRHRAGGRWERDVEGEGGEEMTRSKLHAFRSARTSAVSADELSAESDVEEEGGGRRRRGGLGAEADDTERSARMSSALAELLAGCDVDGEEVRDGGPARERNLWED